MCFQLHRVSSLFLPTLFGWLGQDGYFWVDKALWVTISIIILKSLSPRSNFNDGGEAASLSEETRFVWFWTVILWKTTLKNWMLPSWPSQLLSPLGTPLASRHHRAQIPRSRDACEAWKVKHERWSLTMEESSFHASVWTWFFCVTYSFWPLIHINSM